MGMFVDCELIDLVIIKYLTALETPSTSDTQAKNLRVILDSSLSLTPHI